MTSRDLSKGDNEVCALCQQPIEPRKDFIFRVDGLLQHTKCPVQTRKPGARVPREPAPDPICPECSEPIRAVDSVAKDGNAVVHIRCLDRRPIAGGNALPAWALIGDEHIGRRLGLTKVGHQEFMAACAEAATTARHTATRARRVRDAGVRRAALAGDIGGQRSG